MNLSRRTGVVLGALLAACAGTEIALRFLVPGSHSHRFPGFWAVFGLLCGAALVAVANGLSKLGLQKKE